MIEAARPIQRPAGGRLRRFRGAIATSLSEGVNSLGQAGMPDHALPA
jgi:hypothetical protein